jgi:UPF0755 protein
MKKWLVRLAVALLLVAGVAAAAFLRLYRLAEAPFQGYAADNPALIEVPSGLGPQAIGQRLIDAGVVRDRWTYRMAIWRSGQARRLQAGDYRFDRPLSAIDVIGKIARGEVDVLPLTFPEGLTIAEMSRVFEQSGLGSAASFVEAARETSLIRALDPDAVDLEGYLFPDTYPLSRRADAPHVVRMMVERFVAVLTPEIRDAARARGFSVRQLVTLASLVEKETAKAEERPVVASVYSNRLHLHMALQCDPTVIYALQRDGRYDGNPGLPPGPVAAPGLASLRATAEPATTSYLYFVSRNDGTHAFAETLAEHNRNVEKFQVEYFRAKRLTEQHEGR